MKSPRTITLFAFRDSFLALRKLVWQLAKKECFVMAFIADVKVSLYSSQVDVTVTSETLSVYNVCPPFCREGVCEKSSILAKGRLAPFQFLRGD